MEIKELIDPLCSDDTNLQHLLYAFEGYRALVVNGSNQHSCPYSKGSSRGFSWEKGWQIAFNDTVAYLEEKYPDLVGVIKECSKDDGKNIRDGGKIIEKIKEFADTIKHCGDYGELYINTGENSVFWVAGDADFDPDEVSAGVCSSEAYIINGFRELGIENITIEPEYGPDESDGWECLGKFGIDNWKEKKELKSNGWSSCGVIHDGIA